jgi:hypothetical protein
MRSVQHQTAVYTATRNAISDTTTIWLLAQSRQRQYEPVIVNVTLADSELITHRVSPRWERSTR